MSSEWVKREYQAFYNHCYRPGTRRLIPVLAGQYNVSRLPLFLKQLEAAQLSDRDALGGIIRVLGGTNLEELKQSLATKDDENRNLLHTIAELQSSVSSMRSDFEIATKEKAALTAKLLVAASHASGKTAHQDQPSLSATPGTPGAPGAQETVHASVTSTLSEKDVREGVERAIGETAINTWYGGGFADINSNLVGKKLHALCQGAEIPVLCSMVGEPEQNREKRIKTYLLLKHCSCQKAPVEFVRQALQTFCASLTGGPDANTAADAIKQIALPIREKWKELMAMLSSGPDAHFMVECLSMFTPPDKRVETGVALCDVLATSMERGLIEACVKALKALNYREAANPVTEMMSLGGTLNKASQLAGLLADWRCAKSMDVVREVIERWRYSEEDPDRFSDLVNAYYRLGGASTAAFIGEVLAEAPDELRWTLLTYAVPSMSHEADIMGAVTLVAQDATGERTRAAAQKLISEHQKEAAKAQ